MSSIQSFLNKYTEFETFIKNRNQNSRNGDDFNILDDIELKQNIKKWKLYKNLRNLLTHEDKLMNEVYVSIRETLYQDFLKDVEKIMNPPLVTRIFVPTNRIFKAYSITPLNDVINEMLKKNYTCVPILDNDEHVVGVFSSHSLMLYFQKHPTEIIEEPCSLLIKDFIKFCQLTNHQDIEYKFISKYETIKNVELMFKKSFKQNKRIETMFVTEKGDKSEKILGMLTHWDLNNEH